MFNAGGREASRPCVLLQRAAEIDEDAVLERWSVKRRTNGLYIGEQRFCAQLVLQILYFCIDELLLSEC